MKTVIIIFVLSVLAIVPICFMSVGVSTWSNSMAWRIMDSIDPGTSNEARVIKQEMSDWLDLKNRDKIYNEEYTTGCASNWEDLFHLQFCEWDLADAVKSEDDGDEDSYCSSGSCRPGVRYMDCNSFEDAFKAAHGGKSTCETLPQDLNCMNGAIIDCNENGVADEGDKVFMTTCYAQTHDKRDVDQYGQVCHCAYSESHSGYDYNCGNGRMGQKVFTPMSGVIVQIANHGAWGNEVVIYNCGVVMTFGHGLPTLLYGDSDLYEGKVVNAGDYVTYQGGGTGNYADDGNSTGAHLDFRSLKCYQDYQSGKYGARDFDLSSESIVNTNTGADGERLFDNSNRSGGDSCSEFYTNPANNNDPGVQNYNRCYN